MLALLVAASALAGAWAARPSPDLDAGDERMFEEVLELLRNDSADRGPDSEAARAIRELATRPALLVGVPRPDVHARLLALGPAALKAIAAAYAPELVRPPRARDLGAALAGLVSESEAEEMSKVDGAELAEVLCRFLGARLQQMRSAELLTRITFRGLRILLEASGMDMARSEARELFVVKFLLSASQDGALREALLCELIVFKGMLRPSNSTALRYLLECPEVAGASARIATSPTFASRWTTTLILPQTLRPSLEDELVHLGFHALSCMAETYLPEFPSRRAGPRTLARRLARLVERVAPTEVLGLGDANVVGFVCHWLGVRLTHMPWIVALRRMLPRDLEDLAVSVGLPRPRHSKSSLLVAKLLTAASEDHTLKEKLLGELAASGKMIRIGDASAVAYVDECPAAVRSKATLYKFQGSRSDLRLHLEGVFVQSEPAALKAFVRKFVPECLERRMPAQLAGRLASLLPSIIPPEAAHAMSKLDRVGLVRAMCRFLGGRLAQMPWVKSVSQMPRTQVVALMARLGLPAARTGTRRPRLVAQLVSSALKDAYFEGQLHDEVLASGRTPRPAAATAAEYTEQCVFLVSYKFPPAALAMAP